MALIAALAVAVAAVCAATAGGQGVAVGGLRMSALVFGLTLIPGVVGCALWPRRRPVHLPIAVKVSLMIGGLVLAARGSAAISGSITRDWFLLAVLPLSILWPRVSTLGASLFLSFAVLLASGSPTKSSVAFAGMAAAAAVALVAMYRLSNPPSDSPGATSNHDRVRVLRQSALVFTVAIVAGLLATALLPNPAAPSSGGRTGGLGESFSGCENRLREPNMTTGVLGGLDVAQARSSGGAEKVWKVEATAPEVWRAEVFDRWDGRTWKASAGSPASLYFAGEIIERDRSDLAVTPDDMTAFTDAETFDQKVTVEAASASVLVGAPEPQELCAPSDVVAFAAAFRPRAPLDRHATYRVHSIRFHPSMAHLRRSHRGGEPYQRYLGLPPLSDRVQGLAVEVSRSAGNDYDKATAIERWLRRHIAVNDAEPEEPQDVDVVDALLFDQRAGSPARIATAMAVMLRSIGVPARLASGYLPGRRSLFGGSYVVRARDAHVWVEVPLAAPAWQRFDPTGRIGQAQRADAFLARLGRFLAQIWPLLVALAIALAAGLVRSLVVRRRRSQARPWATRMFTRLVKAGSKRGRPRSPHETVAEYSAALAESVLSDDRLVEVGALVTAAAYAEQGPSADARQWAESVVKDLEAAPKRPAANP